MADGAIFVGLGAVLAGLTGAYGWPYAAMVGGLVLLYVGAKMQRIDAEDAAADEVAD